MSYATPKPTPKSGKLYSQVVIQGSRDDAPLYQLLADCLRNPEAADAVRSVVHSIEGTARISKFLGLAMSQRTPPKIEGEISQEALKQALKPLELGDKEPIWIKTILDEKKAHQSQFRTYGTILLLILCPNIEHFAYSIRAGGNSGELDDFLHRNNYGRFKRQYLPNLKNVTVLPGFLDNGPESYFCADTVASALNFHRLPRLENFSIRTVEDNSDCGFTVTAVPKTSNLKSIRITNSDLTTASLAALIRMPRGLESFTYQTGGEWSYMGGNCGFSSKTFVKALWTQRKTLREIDLDCDARIHFDRYHAGWENHIDQHELVQYGKEAPDPEQDTNIILDRELEFEGPGPLCPSELPLPDTGEYRGTLGSLRDFTSLKRLSIGVRFLLGDYVVRYKDPESREEIMFYPCGRNSYFEMPSRLVDALPQSLEYLQIRGYRMDQSPNWDEAIADLMEQRASKLPNLRTIEGITERIASDVDIPRRKPFESLKGPRRAMTAYFVFMEDVKPLIKQGHPEWSAAQISEELERRWVSLDSRKKQQMEYNFNVDKVRYYMQAKEYDQRQSYSEVSFEKAEDFYKRYMQIDILDRERIGKKGLQKAVQLHEFSEIDVDNILRAIKEEEDKENEIWIKIEGPDYEWIEVEN